MSFCLIILAGGNSHRFRSNIGKPYQKIATIRDGIKVKTENIEMYFKFVCEPVLFFLPV